jgi:hypothetical protein
MGREFVSHFRLGERRYTSQARVTDYTDCRAWCCLHRHRRQS